MRIAEDVAKGGLPVVVEPASEGEVGLAALLAWVGHEREWLGARLLERGALLLRGFAVAGAEDFESLCRAVAPELLGYAGGDSPRSRVSGRVYTSTEYPSPLEIPLHNEMSYARRWPAQIFFCCAEAPREGGETPIGDSRRILAALDPRVRERFEERGVRYLRNLHGGWGLGRSWQETFETSDRAEVERLCVDAATEFHWREDRLYLCERRAAVIDHPQTGEPVWFNQADLWHVSRLGARRAAALLHSFGEAELPQHACYGDGSPLGVADLEAVRAAQRAVEVVFPWRRGDVLLLDNVLVAHGRRPFRGPRLVLTAMA